MAVGYEEVGIAAVADPRGARGYKAPH